MSARIEDMALIRSLSPASRAAVIARARRLRAARPQVLVQAGEALSDVFLLAEGVLQIYALNEQGKEATLYRLRAGEVCLLSLNAAFTDGRYPANVRVDSPAADILRIPGDLVRQLFATEAAVQGLVLHSLTATVGELLARLDEAMLAPLRTRLMGYLARNADPDGRMATTHQALAEALGVTREAVSRELIALKRGKQIATARGLIRLSETAQVARRAPSGP